MLLHPLESLHIAPLPHQSNTFQCIYRLFGDELALGVFFSDTPDCSWGGVQMGNWVKLEVPLCLWIMFQKTPASGVPIGLPSNKMDLTARSRGA